MNARLGWAALVLVVGLACRGDAGREDPAPRSSGGSPRGIDALTAHITALDPSDYRKEIAAVEAALFADASRGPAAPDEVAAALRTLGRRVTDGERIVLARALGAELLELADRAGAGLDPAALATQWMRIRDGLFESAEWFYGAGETAMR